MPLKKFLCASTSYFDGDFHLFSLNSAGELVLSMASEELGNSIKSKQTIVIIARSFYSEKVCSYPVSNKTELKKLLALENSTLSAAESNNTFYHCWQTDNDKHKNNSHDNNQSKVNIWQFKSSVPSALIRLPETLLLALTMPEHKIMQTVAAVAKKDVFITHVNGLVHSLVQSSMVNSAPVFAMSVGVNQTQKAQVVESAQLATQLALGFKKLTLPLLASFIKAPKVENRFQLVKNIALPFTVVFSCYLALSSTYLLYKQQSLQQHAGQNSEVAVALKQQLVLDKQLTRYNAFKGFIAGQTNHTPLWLVLADIFPTAKFTNIRVTNNRYVLRGSATKATDLLEALSDNKQVVSAKFDFPTRKNRGRESFVISFELIAAKAHGETDNG